MIASSIRARVLLCDLVNSDANDRKDDTDAMAEIERFFRR